MKRITGHLTEKNKKWYAVINLYESGCDSVGVARETEGSPPPDS